MYILCPSALLGGAMCCHKTGEKQWLSKNHAQNAEKQKII